MRKSWYVFTLLGLFAASVVGSAQAGDWNHWRGEGQNGVSDETGLPSDWSRDGKNLLWQVPKSGARTAPLVVGDHAYLFGRGGDGVTLQERLLCLDLNTGKEIWSHSFNVFLTDIVELRMAWANLAADPATGNIYVHGIQGEFFCFSPDGEILWRRSLTEEIGRISGYGGRTNTPVVEGDLVIVSSLTSSWGPHGRGLHRFFGLNKLTGEFVWISEPSGAPLDTTYSVPVVATQDGQRVLFAGIADGAVVALQANTGKRLWSKIVSKRGLNSSVVYEDGKVFASQSEENIDSTEMGGVYCLDGRTGAIVWRNDGLRVGYTSPILKDGVLYVADNSANLIALDAATGEQQWAYNFGKEAKGSPVLADGKFYVPEVGAHWKILQLGATGVTELSSVGFELPDGSPDEVFSSAAVAHGKVLLPTMSNLYCISSKPADYRTVDSAPLEAVVASDDKVVAQVQIVPAETWVYAGESVTFRVATYNANGEKLGEVPAEGYELMGLTLEAGDAGVYSAAADSGIQAGTITATLNGMTSSARVRVFPHLPYKEDFNTLKADAAPPGYITSFKKAIVSEHEGEKVLRKLADNPGPPFARLRCYMLPPLATGYTVRADTYGFSKRTRFLPDQGLINARYLFHTTQSNERKKVIRLSSWAAIPRIQEDVEMDWQADTWYSMKLKVDIIDGVGHIKGKIWPRAEAEPEAWSIETTDPSPNFDGSPGLYAYSRAITSTPGTEVLFDNVEVTANK
jgi:outer membrane protein assembly factor BamB